MHIPISHRLVGMQSIPTQIEKKEIEQDPTTLNKNNKECSPIMEADEDSPPQLASPSPQKFINKDSKQKNFKAITINTCFEPPGAPTQSLTIKGTQSHTNGEEYKNPYLTARNQTPNLLKKVSGKKPKHFMFSESLMNPELPMSPYRKLMFTGFLIEKLGESTFEKAKNFLCWSPNPLRSLEEEPGKFLDLIGKPNEQYLPIFKCIVNGKGGATPLQEHSKQFLQQRHNRTKSMHTPHIEHNFQSKVPNSTKAGQQIIDKANQRSIEGKAFISPANSTITAVSFSAISPSELNTELAPTNSVDLASINKMK